jgi:hypothetical protein
MVYHHHQGAVKQSLKEKNALSPLFIGSGAWRLGEDQRAKHLHAHGSGGH